jgi:hypothetical protein
VIAVDCGSAVQGIQVSHRVGGQLGGQIRRVGAPSAGFLTRMNFDQLTTPIQLHRRAIGAGQDPLSDQPPGTEYKALPISTCRSEATLGRL